MESTVPLSLLTLIEWPLGSLMILLDAGPMICRAVFPLAVFDLRILPLTGFSSVLTILFLDSLLRRSGVAFAIRCNHSMLTLTSSLRRNFAAANMRDVLDSETPITCPISARLRSSVKYSVSTRRSRSGSFSMQSATSRLSSSFSKAESGLSSPVRHVE